MNSLLVVVFILMTVVGAYAAYFLKIASSSKNAIELIKNKYFYYGGILYFLSAIINIYMLKFIDFSIILPLTSITYIWTLVIAHRYLNEKISSKKKIGTALIVLGVFVLIS